MERISADAIYQVEGIAEDGRMAARARRLLAGIEGPAPVVVGDEELNRLLGELRPTWGGHHGMHDRIPVTVILNRFRFEDDEQTRSARRARFPNLVHSTSKYDGYGGFDWRASGEPEWRRKTGLVCTPAYQIHTAVGCPYRCAYCGLGYFHNLMLNLEEYVERLDGWLALCPDQTLFQHDNHTDVACFEPEYGSSRLLIEYFAGREGKYLELYVGKSGSVDYLLDLDHRGKTVCCWSVAGRTQSALIERGTAPMEARFEAARKCQAAGYPVRFRFSPIVPVRDWRRENREMIEAIFAATRPDMVTVEPLRFLNGTSLPRAIDLDVMDPEFAAGIAANDGKMTGPGCEIPDAQRAEIYRFILDELVRVSPETPVSFCRERRAIWEQFAPDLARWRQHPDDYVCNCGPWSDPVSASLRSTARR